MHKNMNDTYTIALENDARGFFSPFQLTLQKGHITCLVGESGCGKTTLLRLLCGLDACQSRQNFTTSDVAYMSQLPNLLSWLTVIDNLCLAQKLTNTQPQTAEAFALLDRVGLSHIADAYPNTLSVGMQQRVCLLRTFLQKKPIVLLDEPFSALDHDTRIDLQSMLVDLLSESAVLLVTHDWLDVMRLAQRVYVIKGWPAVLAPMQVNLPTANVPRRIDFDDLFSSVSFEQCPKAHGPTLSPSPQLLSSSLPPSVSSPLQLLSSSDLIRGSIKVKKKVLKNISLNANKTPPMCTPNSRDPRIKSEDDILESENNKVCEDNDKGQAGDAILTTKVEAHHGEPAKQACTSMYLKNRLDCHALSGLAMTALTIFLLLGCWHFTCTYFAIPEYLLPSPTAIGQTFYTNANLLGIHSLYTGVEVIAGILLAIFFAFLCGIIYTFSPRFERFLRPVLVVMQTMPSFLFMPFLLLWFGFGLLPKMIIVTLTGFFPITLAFIEALKRPPPALIELESLFRTTPIRAFIYMRLPAALPAFFTGLRWACLQGSVAVIAADWLGASHGLGYLILTSYSRLQIPLLFCCVIILIVYAHLLMRAAMWTEKKCVFWERGER